MNVFHETSKSLNLPKLGALEISALQRFCLLLAPSRISCHGMWREELCWYDCGAYAQRYCASRLCEHGRDSLYIYCSVYIFV